MCVPGRPRGIPAGVQLRRSCRGQALTLSDFQSWSRAFLRLGKAGGSFPRWGTPREAACQSWLAWELQIPAPVEYQ